MHLLCGRDGRVSKVTWYVGHITFLSLPRVNISEFGHLMSLFLMFLGGCVVVWFYFESLPWFHYFVYQFSFFFWVFLMCFCILFIVTFLVTVFNFLLIYWYPLTVSVLCLSWLCSPLSPPVSTLPISLLCINSPAFPLSYSVCVFFLCVLFFFWFYYMWNIDIKYH